MTTDTEAVEVDKKLDKQIAGALSIMADMRKLFIERAAEVCKIMADMDESGREKLMARALESGAVPSRGWLGRVEACAARNIVGAVHLYGITQVISSAAIKSAKTAALRLIADPNHEFIYVEDSGRSRSVAACELTQMVARRVWDWSTGAISRERQEKEVKLRLGNFVHPSAAAKFGPMKILGGVFGTDEDGEAIVEVTCCPKDAPGIEERNAYYVAELKRLLRGV